MRGGAKQDANRPAPPFWRLVEALAWIRWRDPAAIPYFAGPGAADRWRASKLYASHTIAAPGLPPLSIASVSENAQQQLNLALQDGRVDAFCIDGAAVTCLPAAAFQVGNVTLDSTFNDRGRPLPIVFEADQIRAVWPPRSAFVDASVSDEKLVEDWLRDLMRKGPRPADATKESLRLKAPRAIFKKTFDALYRRVAREENLDWSRPGRRKKS
jgi:hypothetical protein